MTSLYPPEDPSVQLLISHCQPFVSKYFRYMRSRSPANIAASSPPAPPRISRTAFLSSSGSAGMSMSFISSSSSGILSSLLAISSRAISFISGSSSEDRISRPSLILASIAIYSLRAFIRSSSSLYSRVSFT